MKRWVLGVTGGIATGKTTVMKILGRRGVPTLSADDLAHQAIRKGSAVYRHLLKRYGRTVRRSNGQIDRRKLGAIVFRDSAERRWLEHQIHPFVVRKLIQFINSHRGLVAVDIPLLFEARLERLVDQVVVVSAPRTLQIARLRRRNKMGRQEALRRISAQLPLSLKRRRADLVVSNTGSIPHLRRKVEDMLKRVTPR